jgi:general secretion pathway protein D
LTFAASVMLAGLTVAVQAQEGGRAVPPRGRSPRLRPPPRPNPAAQEPEGEGGGEELQEFRTGVDYRPVSPRTRVTFNLEDADLPDLVRLISNMTGKRFIIPGKVRSIKATVFAPTEVTAAEAYNAFLSILEVNGLNVVPAGRYLKIVETSGIESQPIPTLTEGTGAPGDDRYITRLLRLDNVAAEDVVTLLDRFKSHEGSITAYAPTNTLIITDTGRQIRRMMSIIEAVDIARTGEQVWIEAIHYANATELAEKLQEIFPSSNGASTSSSGARPTKAPAARGRRRAAAAQEESGGPSGATVGSSTGESRISNIIPDERTNSLIIIATERAYMRILEMVRRLDIPLEGEGRIHVHYIQHGDAEEIASTLSTLIGGGTSSSSGGGGAGGRRAQGQAAAASGGAAPDLFEGAIRVTSYAPTNALVITSSLHDYAQLRPVIDRLDSPRRQVFIEAVVMELSINRSNTLGFAFHGGIGNFPSNGALSILGFQASQSLNPVNQNSLTGLALGVRGPTIENSQQLIGASIPGFGVVINALATTGDANVLSTPHVIAMDNVQAEITVGENIPLQTSGIPSALSNIGSLAGLAGASGGTNGLAGLASLASSGLGSVPRQDVGTTIRITPHINEADEIRMELEEEISERGATEGSLGVVSINRRLAKTELMVRDQQTVVIGGLMRESVNTAETKIPILGDIPVLGALFRNTQRNTRKTNLLLFLTPYIIRDPGDLRAIFERKMRERQEFLDRYFIFGDHDYQPPVDYSRTRGLLAEILTEIDVLEEERRLYDAAQATPPPEHVPTPPVGAYVSASSEGGEGGDEEQDGDVVIEPEGGAEPPEEGAEPEAVEAPPEPPTEGEN